MAERGGRHAVFQTPARRWGRLFVASILLAATAVSAAPLKLATLVPAGSTWDKTLHDMAARWERETEGRVAVRFYPSGVAGDDPDAVRKMRIGQLQAATLTVTGLAEIQDDFRVFTIPMLFRDYEELYRVLDEMGPDLAAGLREKGFELVHWVPGGWVRFFARSSLHEVADLRALDLFTWAGDEGMVRSWQKNGLRPVALAYPDIPMALESGMIEALPATPLTALSLQWFRRAPFMLDLGVAPLIGATVIRRSSWQAIATTDRDRLLEIAREAEQSMRESIPRQDDAALEEMKKRGLEITKPASLSQWQRTGEEFAASMRGGQVPEAVYDRVVTFLRRLRSELREDRDALP